DHGHRLERPMLRGAERVDFAALIIREYDRVTASGRVVRDETGDWFEPPVGVALPGGLSHKVRPAWHGSIRIVGANFHDDALTGRFECDGAVEGYATLTGIWAARHLWVEDQALPERQHRRSPGWKTPPCPVPPGGWPRQSSEKWEYGRNLDF